MATENYLLSIFRLNEQGIHVTLTILSEHLKTLPTDEGLGTSLPSVGGMIRRMAREGLVETKPSKEVVLTSSGRKSAESVVRRHRLAERLVVDLLGMDMKVSHMEAHRLEHAISPNLEDRIVAVLNNPETCPFGHPIPGSGYKPHRNSVSLDVASEGSEMIIDSVPEDDQALLEYFVENGILPGQKVRVREAAETRGVITLDCGEGEVVFSYDIAAKINVYPA
ncbi:MAG: metal-dependent transcriptional regulator [Dehalococcoidia bacterium]|nr:metal-dependent transcriptional regulator [Dehalococcoidia bacterium]